MLQQFKTYIQADPLNAVNAVNALNVCTPLPLLLSKMMSLCGCGMKTLILDSSTTQSVSVVLSQTAALSSEIYLIQRLDDPKASLVKREPMPHLKAVVFVRPTRANVALLCDAISGPELYSSYHLFFSNILSPDLLSLLASSDPHSRVRQVQEFPMDYVPVNADLWTLNLRGSIAMSQACGEHRHLPVLSREAAGLSSMLLSLKKQPSSITITTSSPSTARLASSLQTLSSSDGIFTFPNSQSTSPLLLLLDRADDPVTPLLSQWTYQAMVHELLGVNNDRVVLRGAPGIKQVRAIATLQPY